MFHNGLRVAAAHHVLGIAEGEMLVNAADDALNDGVYSRALGELYSIKNPTVSECGPLFEQTLKELGLRLPDPGHAVVILLDDRLLKIVEGRGDLLETLLGFRDVGIEQIEKRGPRIPELALSTHFQFVNHSYRIDDFRAYRNAMGFEEHSELEQRQLGALYADVYDDAKTWCHDHRWGPNVETSWLTPTVLILARSIKERKSFDALSILADALQDAGCEHEYILDHLRKSRNHVRCCVFADLLLNCAP